MNIREKYNRQISFYFLIALALHVPVIIFMALGNDKDLLSSLALGVFLLAGPVVLYAMGVTSALLPSVIAFSTIGFSGLLIHLGGGLIELHFHIFIMLAAFIAFGLKTPIVVGVATTAVHHVALFFLLPTSVFNYQASFNIVLLHAFFVILEAVPALYIATKIQRLIKLQDTTVGEIEGIGNKMTATVFSMAASGRELSNSSSQSAKTLEETVTALEELNAIVKLNAENALVASKLSQQSQTSAENGDAEVRSLIASMDRISSSSKKIEEIINVIDDIAFQTNLLALNAAVEAARAGEQGRGFAVVADAVRSLAQRSASAAKDINLLIKESTGTIESGVKVADRSGEVLQAIVASVKKVAEINSEIAHASQEQSNGISQISRSMNSLDASTQENASSSNVVADSVSEIQGYSERMKHLVNDFNKELGFKSKAA
ncbi:MAG: hypothetical protein A2622_09700 [Bdellovibrionales bacterium RIFCSPHIGHO2_01_FULL_40_29]|nr:MAG: hypothetical protein A2622_09700 [Bdellovibrionales bacterium RIFCSPHIGHO2_01_FULL_40_29]OFZ32475.1 MAG: hypothetical protein A3D17_12965 [Bdellovibrionales bacterium RIFCSPHIGHO2_02_FULL_40_15]